MFESVIWTLIYIGLVIGAAVIVLWALGEFGVPLPARAIKIGWVIVGLICILIFWHMLGPMIPGSRLR